MLHSLLRAPWPARTTIIPPPPRPVYGVKVVLAGVALGFVVAMTPRVLFGTPGRGLFESAHPRATETARRAPLKIVSGNSMAPRFFKVSRLLGTST